ncbi:DedA family protein [Clostridium beijerinckii]|uniref:DedA family protein n=1 Tax=Clostridium beijerinckii TaxID=1520 RepID=A0AAW3WDP4_CLOBE|nr:DedA family protein [Clostridium beijerinckii]MBC2458977.1 DedA family protein [Clostridium beijerinckii]MBC2476513.1 DedA family protein [Clostridium beijerinckii]NOV60911.1 membrane protein DedA with SNARE-associated domain [Clostridium beijerinckii]NOV72999.1 membrane protein DedA with SNARE-associated domain [Clostridium beijerinckii]
MDHVIELFNHYGYIAVLISLVLELIAFPLPGEALMTYCGYVVYMNKMGYLLSIIVATSGAIIGITISYFIGRALEIRLIEKYGSYIHLNKNRMDKISTWYQKYGGILLIVAYFIPGIRHITGYFSGMTKVSYKKFAISAYLGALIWTTTFISLGRVLGANWNKYNEISKWYLLIAVLIAILLILLYISYKEKINVFSKFLKEEFCKILYSMLKVKVLVTGLAVLFLIFIVVMIGFI